MCAERGGAGGSSGRKYWQESNHNPHPPSTPVPRSWGRSSPPNTPTPPSSPSTASSRPGPPAPPPFYATRQWDAAYIIQASCGGGRGWIGGGEADGWMCPRHPPQCSRGRLFHIFILSGSFCNDSPLPNGPQWCLAIIEVRKVQILHLTAAQAATALHVRILGLIVEVSVSATQRILDSKRKETGKLGPSVWHPDHLRSDVLGPRKTNQFNSSHCGCGFS